MKCRGLVLWTGALVLLAAFALGGIGWLFAHASSGAPTARSAKVNPLETEAGWRYRQSRPHHWRQVMLVR